MKNVAILLGFVGSILPLACGGTSDQTGGAQTPSATHQTLSAVGDCGFSCGSVPSNLASASSVSCSGPSTAACAWSDSSDPNGTDSYRPCTSAECPTAPAIDCPAGTAQSSQQCGAANDGACAWTTVCTPPRDTTPCPDPNACGAQEDIGVICKDGSTGALVCVTNGTKCSWERNCD